MTTLRRLPWVLSSLDDPRESVGFVGPNWYASVMGTGIVAITPGIPTWPRRLRGVAHGVDDGGSGHAARRHVADRTSIAVTLD